MPTICPQYLIIGWLYWRPEELIISQSVEVDSLVEFFKTIVKYYYYIVTIICSSKFYTLGEG